MSKDSGKEKESGAKSAVNKGTTKSAPGKPASQTTPKGPQGGGKKQK